MENKEEEEKEEEWGGGGEIKGKENEYFCP